MQTILLIATISAALLTGSGSLGSLTFHAAPETEPASLETYDPAEESLAMIVNKANPIADLTWVELRRVFLGERVQWPNGARITIAMRQPAPEREAILRILCRMSEADFSRHLLHSSFTGESSTPLRELSSGAAVRRFVVNVPGAIGYVRASQLDDSVKVLKVEGRLPGEAGYKLRVADH
jgi:ABC-type phosphate transport system substrate-binding protein